MKYLEELEVRHGCLKNEVDCAFLAEKLREEFPDFTWVSAKISGSRLILEVQENETYQHEKEEEPGASDFISDKSGIIVSMITRAEPL